MKRLLLTASVLLIILCGTALAKSDVHKQSAGIIVTIVGVSE